VKRGEIKNSTLEDHIYLYLCTIQGSMDVVLLSDTESFLDRNEFIVQTRDDCWKGLKI
jgi:hypothetical protein